MGTDDQKPERPGKGLRVVGGNPNIGVRREYTAIEKAELVDVANDIEKKCSLDPSFRTQEFFDAVTRQRSYVEKYKYNDVADLLEGHRKGMLALELPYLYALAKDWQSRNQT